MGAVRTGGHTCSVATAGPRSSRCRHVGRSPTTWSCRTGGTRRDGTRGAPSEFDRLDDTHRAIYEGGYASTPGGIGEGQACSIDGDEPVGAGLFPPVCVDVPPRHRPVDPRQSGSPESPGCLWGEDAVIADQGPHDVDLFARHGEQGLGVHLVLAAFVLVVLA